MGLAVHDLEHELAVALGHDRLLRHAQGILLELQQHRHSREQPRAKPLIAVGHHCAHQQAAARHVEPRIDGVNFPLEAVPWEGVNFDADSLPYPDGGKELLRHPEIGLHRIDGFEIDQRLAPGDVLTDTDTAKADNTGERPTNCRLSSCTPGNSEAGVLTATAEADSSA